MERFAEAVSVLLEPQYSGDAKDAALAYVNGVKSSGDGWTACAEGFLRADFSVETRFQCLVVLEHVATHRYVDLDPGQRQSLKELVLNWISSAGDEPSAIRNKEFPEAWPSFFDDLLSLLDVSVPVTFDFFFRVLETIDELVVDRTMSRSQDELARNTHIKDSMRVEANAKIAGACDHCLQSLAASCPGVASQCLGVMVAYVSWIDVELVVNETTMGLVFELCRSSLALRPAACGVLRAVVCKGMDPASKADLVDSLQLVDFVDDQFASVSASHEDDDENAYGVTLAALACSCGTELVGSVRQLVDAGADASSALALLDRVFDTSVRVMVSEWDEISQEILPLAQEYLHLHRGAQREPDPARMEKLLEATVAKMRCDDDSFNFDDMGEDEVEFLDFRESLKVVFDNVAQVAPAPFLATCTAFVEQVLGGGDVAERLSTGEVGVHDVELVLHVVYLLGEAVPAPHRWGEADDASRALTGAMLLVTEGGFQAAQSNAVTLKFFDVCVRLGSFFAVRPDRLPTALGVWLGESGLGSGSRFVQSRACYTFLRFVRQHGRQLLHPYLEEIVGVVQPLLAFDNPAVDHDDQLFLAEMVGQLATGQTVPPEEQRAVLEPLIAGMVDKAIEVQTVHVPRAATAEEMEGLAQALRYFVTMVTAMSKGLASPDKVATAGLDAALGRALQVFMRCLQIPVHKDVVRNGVRVFLHRMIVCMGEHILPLMPEALGSMLDEGGRGDSRGSRDGDGGGSGSGGAGGSGARGADGDFEDLLQFIPLINQLVIKFKAKVAPLLDEVFMPLTRATFSVLQSDVPAHELSTLEEHAFLRRAYVEFLNVIVTHGQAAVMATPRNAPHTPEVLAAVLEGCGSPTSPGAGPDAKGDKICFGLFKQLVERWFAQPEAGGLDGFDDFVLSSVVPVCFSAFLRPDTDLDDAWTHLMVTEVAGVLVAVYGAGGAAFLTYLEDTYFPQVSMPAEAAAAVLGVIQSGDKKALAKTLVEIAKALNGGA